MMRKPLSSSKTIQAARNRRKAIEHSLYFGRERLGMYVQFDRRRFEAFDAIGHPLGSFLKRARALAAIRRAWARCA
jgi:hypothetical protein